MTDLLTAAASDPSAQRHNKKLKMTTTEINYRGENYTCRIVKSNDGENLIIAGTRLLDALMPYPITDSSDGFADYEAEKVDEDIFFYTLDVNLRLPDDKLIEELKEYNPEWFD